MGLDSTLYAKSYHSSLRPDEKKIADKIIKAVNAKAVMHENNADYYFVCVTVPVAYWRKCNHIHKFFCDLDNGRDECQTIFVKHSDIKELVDRCKRVIEDPQLGPTLLPRQPGFFFGPLEYDDDYIDTLNYTLTMIDSLVEKAANEWEFEYRASW